MRCIGFLCVGYCFIGNEQWAMKMGNRVKLAPALRLNLHLHALQVMSNDGSGEFRMTTDVQEKVMAAVTSFGGKKALRCLALAYKHHSGSSSKVGNCHHLFD